MFIKKLQRTKQLPQFRTPLLICILIFGNMMVNSCSDIGGSNCLDCYSTRSANNTEALVKMQLSNSLVSGRMTLPVLSQKAADIAPTINQSDELLFAYAQINIKKATLSAANLWDNAAREKFCKVAITSSTNLTDYDATCKAKLVTQIKTDIAAANVLIQAKATTAFTSACLGSSPTKTPAECKTLARAEGIGFSLFYADFAQTSADLKSAQLFNCSPNPTTIVEKLQASADSNAFLSVLIAEVSKCSLGDLAEICFSGPAQYSTGRAYDNIYPGDLFQTVGCALFTVGSAYYGCSDISSPAAGTTSAAVLKSRFDGTGPNSGATGCTAAGLDETSVFQHIKIGLLWMCGAKGVSSDSGVSASSYEYISGSFAKDTAAIGKACDSLIDTLNLNIKNGQAESLSGIMSLLLN